MSPGAVLGLLQDLADTPWVLSHQHEALGALLNTQVGDKQKSSPEPPPQGCAM